MKSPKTTRNSATGNELLIFNAVITSFILSWTSGKRSRRQVPRKTPPAKQFNRLITRVYLVKRENNINKKFQCRIWENNKYLNFRTGSTTFRIVSTSFNGSKHDKRVTTNNVAKTMLFALFISMLVERVTWTEVQNQQNNRNVINTTSQHFCHIRADAHRMTKYSRQRLITCVAK